MSLNSYLRGVLADAASHPTRAELLQRIRQRSERADMGSASIVREQRDTRAPAHVDVEVVSALRGLGLGQHLSRPGAKDALQDLAALVLHRWELDLPMAQATLELADNLTAYDAAYVVLAQGLDCPLLTRDHRLARAADGVAAVRTV